MKRGDCVAAGGVLGASGSTELSSGAQLRAAGESGTPVNTFQQLGCAASTQPAELALQAKAPLRRAPTGSAIQ